MKLLTFVTILFVSLISICQERINREKITFNSESNKLTNSIGWKYNNVSGEWIDFENVISDRKNYKDEYKSLQGSYMMSHERQNFISIQTKSLIFQNKTYYVLIIEKWNGEYEYPHIKENWKEYKSTLGYIFEESEYKKLNNLNGLVELKTKKMVICGSRFTEFKEVDFLDRIQNELIKETHSYEYTFPIMISKEGNVRFYIPDYFGSGEYFLYGRKYDFTKFYFETDKNNFDKILIK